MTNTTSSRDAGEPVVPALRALLSDALALANRRGDSGAKAIAMRGFNAVREMERRT